ncbi:cold-shock protein [Streptomyces sp. NPDC048297]|uniref:cold-shock protein n=1 Tax=Streptomyces sp. NPDC048297 TaxID=3365531 RepID=UPI00371FBA0A
MVAGRVVRFDGARGYGFIAPADGSEDVFLHVNDLLIPEQQVRPGITVEFDVEEGERGLKASSVRLASTAGGRSSAPMSGVGRSPFPGAAHDLDGDDSICDVFTAAEYTHKVTEILLSSVPSLTGEQIVQVRRAMLQFGKDHGWTEE